MPQFNGGNMGKFWNEVLELYRGCIWGFTVCCMVNDAHKACESLATIWYTHRWDIEWSWLATRISPKMNLWMLLSFIASFVLHENPVRAVRHPRSARISLLYVEIRPDCVMLESHHLLSSQNTFSVRSIKQFWLKLATLLSHTRFPIQFYWMHKNLGNSLCLS